MVFIKEHQVWHQVFQISKTQCLGTEFYKTQNVVFKIQVFQDKKLGAYNVTSMAPSFFKIQKLGVYSVQVPSFSKLVLWNCEVWHQVFPNPKKLGTQVPSFSKPETWCLGNTKFDTKFFKIQKLGSSYVQPSGTKWYQIFQNPKTWCLGTKFFKTQKFGALRRFLVLILGERFS